MRMSDWSSDVCSSDLVDVAPGKGIGDHRGNAADQQRPRRRRATLVEYLLDGGLNLSHLNGQVVLLTAGRLLGSRIVCRDRPTAAIFSLSLSGLPRGPIPPPARPDPPSTSIPSYSPVITNG